MRPLLRAKRPFQNHIMTNLLFCFTVKMSACMKTRFNYWFVSVLPNAKRADGGPLTCIFFGLDDHPDMVGFLF